MAAASLLSLATVATSMMIAAPSDAFVLFPHSRFSSSMGEFGRDFTSVILPLLASSEGDASLHDNIESICTNFSPKYPSSSSSELQSLLTHARHCLVNKDTNGAFDTLALAYQIDPTLADITAMFEKCLALKVELAEDEYNEWRNDIAAKKKHNTDASLLYTEQSLHELFQDRMGLASLLIDKEHYDEAGKQLQLAIDQVTFWLAVATDRDTHSRQQQQQQYWQTKLDNAQYLLYKTNAACCSWTTYFTDGDKLRQSTLLAATAATMSKKEEQPLSTPMLHPFDALKYPSITLQLASEVARCYSHRAIETTSVDMTTTNKEVQESTRNVARQRPRRKRKIVTVERNNYNPSTMEGQKTTNNNRKEKMRIGYISPDFTSQHPLAFLMQHVFGHHDKSNFVVYIYSLSSSSSKIHRDDKDIMEFDGPEVKAIHDSADVYTTLSPTLYKSPMNMYNRIMDDELDILVDLCGYAGTSMVAEIMSCRYHYLRKAITEESYDTRTDFINTDTAANNDGQPQRKRFPIHVSYMGFPGSCGSSRVWDYSIFDTIVVPPLTDNDYDDELVGGPTTIRNHYEEALMYMPNSYFVNSHKSAIGGRDAGIIIDPNNDDDERSALCEKYGLPTNAFIYCCHSRPDKIDPTTFRSWIRTIVKVRSECINRRRNSSSSGNEEEGDGMPVLWLLRSGDEMEKNLRQLVCNEFGKEIETECLVFANIVERNEHLHRLGVANVFLDTPAYNAHTLGCDALYMGVLMISLLRHENTGDIISSTPLEMMRADVDPVRLDRDEKRSIPTDKLASRVGASLLTAIGLNELICPTMTRYEDVMARCALDKGWYIMLRKRLLSSIDTSPLFDTALWVRNLEAGFVKMVELNNVEQYADGNYPDIIVKDNSS